MIFCACRVLVHLVPVGERRRVLKVIHALSRLRMVVDPRAGPDDRLLRDAAPGNGRRQRCSRRQPQPSPPCVNAASSPRSPRRGRAWPRFPRPGSPPRPRSGRTARAVPTRGQGRRQILLGRRLCAQRRRSGADQGAPRHRPDGRLRRAHGSDFLRREARARGVDPARGRDPSPRRPGFCVGAQARRHPDRRPCAPVTPSPTPSTRATNSRPFTWCSSPRRGRLSKACASAPRRRS